MYHLIKSLKSDNTEILTINPKDISNGISLLNLQNLYIYDSANKFSELAHTHTHTHIYIYIYIYIYIQLVAKRTGHYGFRQIIEL